MSDAPRRGRPPALGEAERAAKLLAATRFLFGQFGYSKTTMEMIASKAGMSTRTLYQHFPDKRTILDTLFRQQDPTQPVVVFDPAIDHKTQLQTALTRAANHALSQHQIALTRIAIGEAISAPEICESFYENALDHAFNSFSKLLLEMQKSGGLRSGDPDILADMILGGTIGRLHLRRLTSDKLLCSDEERALQVRITAVIEVFCLA